MPDFIYEGKARGGKAVTGEYTAANRDELFKYLRSRGIMVTKVKRKPRKLSLTFGTGVTSEDITNFARQFSAMISATEISATGRLSSLLITTAAGIF